MAITKTFTIFGDESTNIYTDSAYSALTERQTGFIPNTTANSKLANTAIMANAKFVSCLIDLANNAGVSSLSFDVGPNTSESNIQSFFTLGLAYFVNQKATLSVVKTTVDGSDSFAFSVGLGGSGQTYTIANIRAASAKTADEATQAGNVKTAIGGQILSAIFESNGTTVKKATSATSVEGTDFTNAAEVDYYIDSASVAVNLTNGATYQVYVSFVDYNDLIDPEIDDQQRINLGTFRYVSGQTNNIGCCYASLISSGLIGMTISETGYLNLFMLNSSFNKSNLISTSVSTHKFTSYRVKFRRIK